MPGLSVTASAGQQQQPLPQRRTADRPARRRAHKAWRRAKKAEAAWRGVTQKPHMAYEVVLPSPDTLAGAAVAAAEQQLAALELEPGAEEQQPQQQPQQQQGARSRRQRPQQLRPGPVRGPEAPPGALWVEHRRSEQEELEFRHEQLRRRPAPRRQPSIDELLATNEQMLRLQLGGSSSAGRAPAAQQLPWPHEGEQEPQLLSTERWLLDVLQLQQGGLHPAAVPPAAWWQQPAGQQLRDEPGAEPGPAQGQGWQPWREPVELWEQAVEEEEEEEEAARAPAGAWRQQRGNGDSEWRDEQEPEQEQEEEEEEWEDDEW